VANNKGKRIQASQSKSPELRIDYPKATYLEHGLMISSGEREQASTLAGHEACDTHLQFAPLEWWLCSTNFSVF
jgi:hypothetical protein